MEVIHETPIASSYTPLSQFQSQTPESFYTGPPVLYHLASSASLVIPESECASSPAFTRLRDASIVNGEGAVSNGDGVEHDEEVIIDDIDIWVTSEKFILFRPSTSTGISLTYPSISLHAIQRLRPRRSAGEVRGLYLQISTSDGFDDHDPDETISLTLVPSAQQAAAPADGIPETSGPASQAATPVSALYAALSACADLHPDPGSPSSSNGGGLEDGGDEPAFEYASVDGLPPPMPGSGGWITAESVGQFFDEEGNWRGRNLGPGAGTTRVRDEDGEGANGVDAGAVDGNGTEGEETKWRRTS